jgi:cold shock CspA family protein
VVNSFNPLQGFGFVAVKADLEKHGIALGFNPLQGFGFVAV